MRLCPWRTGEMTNEGSRHNDRWQKKEEAKTGGLKTAGLVQILWVTGKDEQIRSKPFKSLVKTDRFGVVWFKPRAANGRGCPWTKWTNNSWIYIGRV
jgi:hypothetical protein